MADEAVVEPHDSLAAQRTLVRRLVLAAAAVVLVLVVRTCVAEPVTIRSDSMAPTLNDGDVIVIDKLSATWRTPHRGEIVVVRSPDTRGLIVKRVVAVGGDAVGLDDGRLVVNGAFVVEPYADNDRMEGSYYGPITVPDGSVFLLGDNRHDSSDSRLFGPVATGSIVGRVAFHLWPIG
ncbi:MAG: signal peptidase I [Acidimicrobiaceae bacterium]|nr:MAG: signal peptidase I [Acidimicrobiaceae bacterium]